MQKLYCSGSVFVSYSAPPPENFAMTPEDELTLEGFMQLHVLSARDEEGGGEGELRSTLTALGYNPRLVLDEVKPARLPMLDLLH